MWLRVGLVVVLVAGVGGCSRSDVAGQAPRPEPRTQRLPVEVEKGPEDALPRRKAPPRRL